MGIRLAMIDRAERSIDAQYFLMKPDSAGRLFNPVGRTGTYMANYLGNFKLANRRMHNKSFTVDNQESVIGGRNIADEYFEKDKAALCAIQSCLAIIVTAYKSRMTGAAKTSMMTSSPARNSPGTSTMPTTPRRPAAGRRKCLASRGSPLRVV